MSAFEIRDYRRLVIKVGSSLLTDANGELDRNWLEGLAQDIAALHEQQHDVLVVSSGAIAIGSTVLGINRRRARLEDLQAAAATGQVQLAYAYNSALWHHSIVAAWAPSGRRLATGDVAGRLRVWSIDEPRNREAGAGRT